MIKDEGNSAAWGDFDGDGDLDFVMAGGGVTRVYRNNGDQTFTDIAAGLPVSTSAAWCDYDSDGDLEILLNGENCLRFNTRYKINYSRSIT